MALPLAQADLLTIDALMAGIVEETVEEDALLSNLPFETISGYKQVSWNRESTLGAESQYIQPNEEIGESSPTFSNQTQTLSILADRVELDNFLVTTKDAVQSIEAAVIASKGKQMMRKFHDTFYYGSTSSDANAFNGLHSIVSSSLTIENGSGGSGAAGSLAELTQLLTTVKPGRADVIIMNRNLHRRISTPYISNVQFNIDHQTIGNLLTDYGEIPIMVTDYLKQTETLSGGSFASKTGGATGTIFAVKWGRSARSVPGANGVYNNDGILGIQACPMQVGGPIELSDKLGFARKMSWYHTVIQGSTLSLAAYTGLTDAAFTV